MVLGGTPVFRGTGVPFQPVLDYLEGGQTLDEFLDDFRSVTREVAVRALEYPKSLVVIEASGFQVFLTIDRGIEYAPEILRVAVYARA